MALNRFEFEGLKIYYQNEQEFRTLFSEIFEREQYYFLSDRTDPVIIDCGSHIGLSVLYFKLLYPEARIKAFEPGEVAFRILKKNISENRLKNIELFNVALTSDNASRSYYQESQADLDTCGNTLIPEWGARNGFTVTKVQTRQLSDYINSEIDFLKADIEGSETEVIADIHDRLTWIKAFFIEFHMYKGCRRKKLDEFLDMLRSRGFKLEAEVVSIGSFIPERYSDWVMQQSPEICSIKGVKC